MPRHALGFEFELVSEPAARDDAADGQLEERAGRQRLAVGGVKRIARTTGGTATTLAATSA